MKRDAIRTRKAFFTGFVMTLLACCFVLFSGVALWNTARDMFGNDIPLVEANVKRNSSPEVNIRVADTEYEISLSGWNEAVGLAQEYYPLVPRRLRAACYLLEGLQQGTEALQRAQERTKLGDKLFCQRPD